MVEYLESFFVGVCKGLTCVEEKHKGVVFQIDVWDGTDVLEKYYEDK
jgi:hypothetical protein